MGRSLWYGIDLQERLGFRRALQEQVNVGSFLFQAIEFYLNCNACKIVWCVEKISFQEIYLVVTGFL